MLLLPLAAEAELRPAQRHISSTDAVFLRWPLLGMNEMHSVLKIVISVAIILAATTIGKKFPSMAGLIGVMPLAGALVLVWMYMENKGNPVIMQEFTKGALWGILPSVLFYVVAFACFRKQLPLSIVLLSSFGAWIGAAFVHQWLLK